MRGPRGLTLVEILLVLGLVVLLYALIGTTTVQVGQYSRRGVESARLRLELVRAADRLRWQLRGLYMPAQGKALEGRRTGEEGRDVLTFLTNRPARGEGVVEVGYRIQVEPLEDEQASPRPGEVSPRRGDGESPEPPFLVYREFPYPAKEGLHDAQEYEEARWRVLAADIESLELEYSVDGVLWQQEWDEGAPRNVRVTLRTRSGLRLSYVVTPGMAAPRW